MLTAHLIIEQLVHSGVRHFCIAPGSRSTPLVCAAAKLSLCKTHVHFDERGLAFYALGIAKVTKKPVAIIVTSGTALANLLPAVMEACHTRTPLILLTADRPQELQDVGENQACNQRGLFGKYVVEEFHLASDQTLNHEYYTSLLGYATAISQNGPVHINCPFREPFPMTNSDPNTFLPHTRYIWEKTHPDDNSVEYFAKKCAEYKKGVILLGQGSSPVEATLLADRLQWPIFTDILSQSRSSTPSDPSIPYFDFLLKKKEFAPDAVLHFGGSFVSKALFTHLKKKKPKLYLHVEKIAKRQDPFYLVTDKVVCDPNDFCKKMTQMSGMNEGGWLPTWKEWGCKVRDRIGNFFLKENSLSEALLFHMVEKMALDEMPLFLGNGWPIRAADTFFFPNVKRQVFGNRGVSGIDGLIATACGCAAACGEKVLAIIGDQSALHDLNSLALLKNCILLIVNNRGGQIFSKLPIANHTELYDKFFAAKHTLDFASAAAMFGHTYLSVDTVDTLIEALARAKRGDSTVVIEMFTKEKAQIETLKKLENHLNSGVKVECLIGK